MHLNLKVIVSSTNIDIKSICAFTLLVKVHKNILQGKNRFLNRPLSNTMKITVIIATYGKPKHLNRALAGYACQDDNNFEIIVTEDGSEPEIQKVVREHKQLSKFPITHLTQKDIGFRKTVALNRAIDYAKGDYLIFTDDDCIPRKDVVSTHRSYAQPGRYIVGAYNRLPLKTSQKVTVENIRSQQAFRLSWMIRNGFIPTRGFIRMIVPKWLARIMDMRGPLQPGRFPGGHSSCFKSDAVAVGGFNEQMHYGLEDREFGHRLCNSGLIGKRVKNSTFMLHLEHSRPYRNMKEFSANRIILNETIRTGRIKSAHLDNTE